MKDENQRSWKWFTFKTICNPRTGVLKKKKRTMREELRR